MPALPESIRRQAELSNQLSAKLKAGTLTAQDVAMRPEQVTLSPTPPAMPNGFQPQLAGAGVPGLGTPGFQPQPAAAPQPSPAAAPAASPAAPVAPAAPEDAAAEHRFKVLQGKYNAEVPRLHQTVKEKDAQLQAMQNQLQATQSLLATLGAQQAQPPSLPQHSQNPSLVTEKEVQEYGADLIDVVRRAALEVVQPKIRSLEEQFRPVAQTVQQLTPAVQQTAESQARTEAELKHEQMCNGLDANVPNWEQINESPEFHAWLSETDPYAGVQRGAMLSAAYRNHDLPRVVTFFTGFMKEHAAVAPTGQQQTSATTGQTQAVTPTVSLASLAAPGTGVGGPVNAGAPNESGQQRVYTGSEIKAFYADVQRGLYRGRQAEKEAIEKDIFLAQKSGRIRP